MVDQTLYKIVFANNDNVSRLLGTVKQMFDDTLERGEFFIGNFRESAALGGGKFAPALDDKADEKIELPVRHIENRTHGFTSPVE